MCANFDYNLDLKFTTKRFGIIIDIKRSGRAVPYKKVPVVINRMSHLELVDMNFSLIPHWSKENKVKFATHNARLYSENKEPIYTKPSWKIPFQKNHCLVVMENFIESVHEGEYAGNLIAFSCKSKVPLIAAGIWDTWISKQGEVMESFAILTHEPPKFVADNGHDRCPVFLNEAAQDKWLSITTSEPKTNLDFLLSNLMEPELEVSIDRPLKNFKSTKQLKLL